MNDIKSLAALIGVTFFSTIASMMVITTLPAFYAETLHLTYSQIGTIEGASAFVAFLSKFSAGLIPVRFCKHKSMMVLGTFLSFIAKGCFALATGFVSVFFFRLFDRFAKGVRSYPSDAMVADLVNNQSRGLYYGLKYTLFMCGGVCGGYVTYRLMHAIGTNFKVIFSLAMIPAFMALWLSRRYITEPEYKVSESSLSNLSFWAGVQSFDRSYWRLLWVVFLLMFARFSETFIMLKARKVGFSNEAIPLISTLYDLFAAGSALFFGVLSVRLKKEKIFRASLLIHAVAHVVFCCAFTKPMIVAGGVLAGLHMGMSQGFLLALIAKHSSQENRGIAFSFYYFIAGVGLLLSNALAGKLNDLIQSPSGAFIGGVLFCCLAWKVFPKLYDPKVTLGSDKL